MSTKTAQKTQKATVHHTCGHNTYVEIDHFTKTWVDHWASQPCFRCQPTQDVVRLCEHTEAVARFFSSPRFFESAAMQLCKACQRPAVVVENTETTK